MTEEPRPLRLFVAAATGFAAGSINPATIIARARGVNLREIGSGNPGATNTARAMGVPTGVAVGAIDVLKGYIPPVAFSRWDPMAGEIAGLSSVLGHIYSPFLRGKGGKGVATTLGAVLGVQPRWAVPMLVAFGGTLAVTKKVGIGAVAGAGVLIGLGVWGTDRSDEEAFAIALGSVVILRHRANIQALLAGRQEPADDGDALESTL